MLLFSGLRPAVGQELLQLASLQRVDPSKHIRQVGDRIDLVPLAGCKERQVDRGRFATDVRADEKAVLTHQNEILDGLLGFVIINVEFRIFEKLSERNPVVERVIDCRQERMCWVERSFHSNKQLSKLFDQRFRSFAPSRQFIRCWQTIKIAPARVSVASSFRFGSVLEERIESARCLRLHETAVILQPSNISLEGLIRREVEEREIAAFVADVNSLFSLAHFSFERAILNLDLGIIRFDHFGFENFFLHQIPKWLESKRRFDRAGMPLSPLSLKHF